MPLPTDGTAKEEEVERGNSAKIEGIKLEKQLGVPAVEMDEREMLNGVSDGLQVTQSALPLAATVGAGIRQAGTTRT